MSFPVSSPVGVAPAHQTDPPSDRGAPRARLARVRAGVRRRVLVHRRGLAAVLVALAVLLALQDLRPPARRTTVVWTAAHDLASGSLLGAADLHRSAYSPGTVPDGTVRDPSALFGRTLAAPLRRGAPLTDLSVLGESLLASDPGRVAVPVRIADAGAVALLHVGDRLDLVAVDPDTSRPPAVVAIGARVTILPEADSPGAVGNQSGRLLVVSVLATEATTVAAAGVSGYLTLTLTP